jgi:hypothetical protein
MEKLDKIFSEYIRLRDADVNGYDEIEKKANVFSTVG